VNTNVGELFLRFRKVLKALNVESLQRLLSLRGHGVGQDGAFGPQTTTAVKNFQQKAGLARDGVVGPATWNALHSQNLPSQNYGLASTGAASGQNLPRFTPQKSVGQVLSDGALRAADPTWHDPVPTRNLPTLSRGNQGEHVTLLQQRLKNSGITGLQIDGEFGPSTEDAVRQIQSKFGLQSDGIVGPATWSRLLQQSKAMDRAKL
jgi:peptidoglycan hydrolase-like protein with peptidoglycan-binding domain